MYWGLLAHRSGSWKLILDEDDASAPARLFDVEKDPGEASDLAAAHPEVVARLRRQLDAFWQAPERAAGSP